MPAVSYTTDTNTSSTLSNSNSRAFVEHKRTHNSTASVYVPSPSLLNFHTNLPLKLENRTATQSNKINYQIALESKADSSAMKAIAILTMFFLPRTFVASFFAMPLFNWDAETQSGVVKSRFWIYWAITVPGTVLVLVVWRLWWVFTYWNQNRDVVGSHFGVLLGFGWGVGGRLGRWRESRMWRKRRREGRLLSLGGFRQRGREIGDVVSAAEKHVSLSFILFYGLRHICRQTPLPSSLQVFTYILLNAVLQSSNLTNLCRATIYTSGSSCPSGQRKISTPYKGTTLFAWQHQPHSIPQLCTTGCCFPGSLLDPPGTKVKS
jgi:hypothetical protein